MTNEELYRVIEGRLDKIETKLDGIVTRTTCKAIRESCDEKIELKFKNQKLWTMVLLAAAGVNAGAAALQLLGK